MQEGKTTDFYILTDGTNLSKSCTKNTIGYFRIPASIGGKIYN